MSPSRTLRAGLAAVLMTFVAVPLAGQSLTSIRGLGYPIQPADARTDVLGGLGIGLKGLAASLHDPAAPAGAERRGVIVSLASVEQTAVLAGESEDFGATRFPLIQVLYPVRGIVLSAGYGGYLDQSWAVVRDGEQTVDGSTLSYTDFMESRGGIGQVQLGVAAPIGSRFAVGGTIGAHTGSRQVRFQRAFDESDLGGLDPFSNTRTVEYSGPTAQLGARWDPSEVVRLAGSVTWSGTLSASDSLGTREYDLPLRISGGASAYLATSLLATVSARWSGWSSVGGINDFDFGDPVVSTPRETWEIGAGLELDDPTSRSARNYPIRVGGHYRQLPFSFAGEAPTEWFVGAGAGMRLGPDVANPFARLDLTVQRGERSAPGDELTPELAESAWRFALSLSIFGN